MVYLTCAIFSLKTTIEHLIEPDKSQRLVRYGNFSDARFIVTPGLAKKVFQFGAQFRAAARGGVIALEELPRHIKGVTGENGINCTLSLWHLFQGPIFPLCAPFALSPDVIAGQINMFPTQRR